MHNYQKSVNILARILAIDFGTKKSGIAVSDTLKIIASGLTTVATKQLIPFLVDYMNSEDVACFVIGEPKRMNNQPSDIETNIQLFLKKLNNKFPNIPVHRVDERFTSKIAFQSMIDSGMNKKRRQNKELIDEISATLILQSFMAQDEK